MSKASLLIVEDEEIVAADLANKLVRLGYEVSGSTGRGEEALGLARERHPDLVLMDIRLKGSMDGVEAAARIRQECDLPVIYLTAHSDRATLERAKLTEPFGYILKPFEASELETHIEMALYKHQTERKLRQSEERFRLALLNKPLTVFQQDSELRYTWIHSSHPEFHSEKMLGKTDAELQPPEYAIPLTAFKRKVLETGKGAREEIQALKNGAVCWWDLTLEPWLNAAGAVIGLSGAAMNITERKRMETALRESELRYRAIGESINYGVWVCAPDGRNIYASPSFLRLVGLTQQQCSDFGWGNVLHPEDAERTIDAWKECVRVGGTWDIEHRFRGVDGQWHPILARGVPVRNEQGEITCWAGINLDISRLKQTEAELRQAQAKLQAHAEELEKIIARRTAKLHETIGELEHFSYTVVHDLRAPLRAMQSFAELIQDEGLGNEHPLSQQYLRRIRVAASRMDQLITDSLNYSKAVRQELPLGPVDLGQLLASLIDTYPNLQPDRADIRLEGEFPVVLGNEAALTQCFSNLLGNAVKFVRPGIRAEVRVRAETPAERVRVWVEDNGIGIRKEMQGRLFTMFQRATKDYEGTGIGLAIVRKVVQRMGGEVGLESEEGQGSRFWVVLPVAPLSQGAVDGSGL